MADVALVIKIDKDTYNDIKRGKVYSSTRDVPLESVLAIANGVSLDDVKAENKTAYDMERAYMEVLRDLFCNTVNNVFGDAMTFLDFLENEKYSPIKYDCYLNSDGENYIINRETGEYINWYKLYHIGRCINISIVRSGVFTIPEWIEFKESEDKV